MTVIRILAAALVALCSAPLSTHAQTTEAQTFLTRGKQAFERGDYRGAVEAFSGAARVDPEFAGAYYGLCLAYMRLDEARRALDECTRAIRLKGDYASAYYVRGLVLSERLGDNQAAVADFDQAIRLEAQHAAAYFKRGNARIRLGDRTGGLADYDTAIRLQPSDADALFNRGVVRFQNRDRRGALTDMQQAARIFRERGDQAGYERAMNGVRHVETSPAP